MKSSKTARAARVRRHARVRHDVAGTPDRPRLAIFRSLSHIYAQVIDDAAGHTLASSCDLDAEVRKGVNGKKKSEVAGLVGTSIARKAKDKGITAVVFDRGGFKYHGRVKALADAARKGGLTF